MRKLFKLAFIIMLMAQVSSCGKKNSSGGGSSSSTSGITGTINNVYNGSGDSFGDFNTLRNHYQNMNLSSGLSNNMVIYHTGTYFGAQSSSGSFNSSYCVNLIFKQWGDCNTGNSNQIENILDRGEYKVVTSTTSNSPTFKKAVGVSTYNNVSDFAYSNAISYTRDDGIYKEMLNLDGRSTRKIVVSPAKARLSNGQEINADLVEYFYNDGSIKRFILSPAVPLLANPIAVIGSSSVNGRLNNYGSISITSIEATLHGIQQNYYSNTEVTVYIQQQITL